MDYYILQKSIDNTIELHIACPKKGMSHWAFTLHISEINAFKEIDVNIVPREPLINDYQLVSVICPNKEVANHARDLLDSLLMSWALGGENRFA